MTNSALGFRRAPTTLRAVGRNVPLSLLVVVPWAALTVAVWFGRVPVSPRVFEVLLFGAPVISIAVLLASRDDRVRSVAGPIAGGTFVVSAAILGSIVLSSSPRLVVGLILLCVAVAAARRWPATLICAAFALSGAPGLVQVYGHIYPGRITDFVMLGLWIAVVSRLVADRDRAAMRLGPATLAVAGFALLTFVMGLVSPATKTSLLAFRQTGWILAMCIPVAYGGWLERSIRRAAHGAVFVAAFVGAWGTLRWITGPTGRETALFFGGGSYNTTSPGLQGLKAVSPQLSGHALGAWTAIAIPFCVAAVLFGRKSPRFEGAIAVVLLAVAMLGSGNRTGLIAALVGTVTVLLLARSARSTNRRLTTVAAVAAGLVVLGLIAFPLVARKNPGEGERYANAFSPSKDDSLQQRIVKWKNALRDAGDHPFGHGLGTAPPPRPDEEQRFTNAVSHSVDSTYVQVAYEQGLAVMILFVFALLLLLRELGRSGRRANDVGRAWVAIGACGALAAFMVMIATAQYLVTDLAEAVFLMAGLGLAPFVAASYDDHAVGAGVAVPALARR